MSDLSLSRTSLSSSSSKISAKPKASSSQPPPVEQSSNQPDESVKRRKYLNVTARRLTGPEPLQRISALAHRIPPSGIADASGEQQLTQMLKEMQSEDWSTFTGLPKAKSAQESPAMKEARFAFDFWRDSYLMSQDPRVQGNPVLLAQSHREMTQHLETLTTHLGTVLAESKLDHTTRKVLSGLGEAAVREIEVLRQQAFTAIEADLKAWEKMSVQAQTPQDRLEQMQVLRSLAAHVDQWHQLDLGGFAKSNHPITSETLKRRVDLALAETRAAIIAEVVTPEVMAQGSDQAKAHMIFENFMARAQKLGYEYVVSQSNVSSDLLAGDKRGICGNFASALSECFQAAGLQNVSVPEFRPNPDSSSKMFITRPIGEHFVDQTAQGNLVDFGDHRPRYLFSVHYLVKVDGVGLFDPTAGHRTHDEAEMRDRLVEMPLERASQELVSAHKARAAYIGPQPEASSSSAEPANVFLFFSDHTARNEGLYQRHS